MSFGAIIGMTRGRASRPGRLAPIEWHAIDNVGLVACGRNLRRSSDLANRVHKSQFLRGFFGPTCAVCRQVVRDNPERKGAKS